MLIAQHADTCQKQFGRNFYDIHLFLDQFANEFPGYAHRRLLHHRLGIELVVKKYGENARPAAELHVRQDTSGLIPDDWSDYGEPILLLIEDYDRQDVILKDLYGDKTFHSVQAKLSGNVNLNGREGSVET